MGLALSVLAPPDTNAAKRRWSVYKNKSFHFRFLVPKGWAVNDQRTHPSILVTARSPEGATVKVAVKVMPTRITLMAFARREKQVLKKLGFATSPLAKGDRKSVV